MIITREASGHFTNCKNGKGYLQKSQNSLKKMKLVAQGGITNKIKKKKKTQGAAGPQQWDHVWSQEPQQLYYFFFPFFFFGGLPQQLY